MTSVPPSDSRIAARVPKPSYAVIEDEGQVWLPLAGGHGDVDAAGVPACGRRRPSSVALLLEFLDRFERAGRNVGARARGGVKPSASDSRVLR